MKLTKKLKVYQSHLLKETNLYKIHTVSYYRKQKSVFLRHFCFQMFISLHFTPLYLQADGCLKIAITFIHFRAFVKQTTHSNTTDTHFVF